MAHAKNNGTASTHQHPLCSHLSKRKTSPTPAWTDERTHVNEKLEEAAILVQRLQNLVLPPGTACASRAPDPPPAAAPASSPSADDRVRPGVVCRDLRLRVDDALHEAQARGHALPTFHVL